MKNRFSHLSAMLLGWCLMTSSLHAEEGVAGSYEPRAGLHFADLEFAMPRDSLLRETEVAWKLRQTPQAALSNATEAVRAAVPVGMAADQASQVLHKAGARCRPAGAQAMVCHYAAVQTRDEGMDAIDWTVQVALANGQVAGLTLARAWRRH